MTKVNDGAHADPMPSQALVPGCPRAQRARREGELSDALLPAVDVQVIEIVRQTDSVRAAKIVTAVRANPEG